MYEGSWYLIKDRSQVNVSGPLAQSAERGADNAKVVSSTLTRTNIFLTGTHYLTICNWFHCSLLKKKMIF